MEMKEMSDLKIKYRDYQKAMADENFRAAYDKRDVNIILNQFGIVVEEPDDADLAAEYLRNLFNTKEFYPQNRIAPMKWTDLFNELAEAGFKIVSKWPIVN